MEYIVSNRLIEVDGTTLDMEQIVSITEKGHVDLKGYMSYCRVEKSTVPGLIRAWGQYLDAKKINESYR